MNQNNDYKAFEKSVFGPLEDLGKFQNDLFRGFFGGSPNGEQQDVNPLLSFFSSPLFFDRPHGGAESGMTPDRFMPHQDHHTQNDRPPMFPVGFTNEPPRSQNVNHDRNGAFGGRTRPGYNYAQSKSRKDEKDIIDL